MCDENLYIPDERHILLFTKSRLKSISQAFTNSKNPSQILSPVKDMLQSLVKFLHEYSIIRKKSNDNAQPGGSCLARPEMEDYGNHADEIVEYVETIDSIVAV